VKSQNEALDARNKKLTVLSQHLLAKHKAALAAPNTGSSSHQAGDEPSTGVETLHVLEELQKREDPLSEARHESMPGEPGVVKDDTESKLKT
jgi:hypothetical protein